MYVKQFKKLPVDFQNETIKPYFDYLQTRKGSLFCKRCLDILVALIVLILSFPFLLVSGILVKATSKGPLFYMQKRVGIYGKEFAIFKFRTMVQNADKIGTQITVGERDPRITKVGHFLRITRLDEFPQMLNVLKGDMTIIGTRPEVPRYVAHYTDEMKATLLLPPGASGAASIAYRKENEMLKDVADPEQFYIDTILPDKMAINLAYLKSFSIWKDFALIFRTVLCVFQK
ncbi:MAG: sugar transferase [Clostridia bacterium]|nr:sugar transferase [Clostridia bacterium]